MQSLPRAFYDRDTREVAADLLGKVLVLRDRPCGREGRIVETEAYLGEHDRACHSSRGRTARTETMYGPPGHAYVYLIYGMYHCLNAVTEAEGLASAVLLRAIEPLAGIEARCDGPGRLCRALGVDRAFNGLDLVNGPLTIMDDGMRPASIDRRPRIGVAYAGPWARRRLRFLVRGNPHVSRA